MSVTFVVQNSPQINPNDPPSLKDQILALIGAMNEAHLFSDQALQEIEKWKNEFHFDWLEQLDQDLVREAVSDSLCYLLYASIRPTLYVTRSAQDQTKLYHFEKTIKNLLERTIPKNIRNVEDFLHTFNEGKIKLLLLQKQSALTQEIFNEGHNQLAGIDRQLKEKNVQGFHNYKQEIKEINTQRKRDNSEMANQLQEMDRIANALIFNLEQHASKAAVAGEELQKSQQQFATRKTSILNFTQRL